MEDFLKACANGDELVIRNCLSQGLKPSVSDSEGNNGAHLAVLNGHWLLAWKLIRFYKVSPYKLNNHSDTIYHSIIQGSVNHPPTQSHYAEFIDLQTQHWAFFSQKKNQRVIEAAQTTNAIPSESLIGKDFSSLKDEMFSNPYFTLPLYILNKYNVSIKSKNNAGMNAAELAQECNLPELADFFKVQDGEGKRFLRLIGNMNENLLKEVAIYL